MTELILRERLLQQGDQNHTSQFFWVSQNPKISWLGYLAIYSSLPPNITRYNESSDCLEQMRYIGSSRPPLKVFRTEEMSSAVPSGTKPRWGNIVAPTQSIIFDSISSNKFKRFFHLTLQLCYKHKSGKEEIAFYFSSFHVR